MFSAESENLERSAAFSALRSIFRAEVGVKGNHRPTEPAVDWNVPHFMVSVRQD
jgi:hypothetical protein